MIGTDQDDELIGGAGVDVIVGGRGRDHIEGRGGNDFICGGGGAGNERDPEKPLEHLSGGAGDDMIGGGLGDDVILAGEGNDVARAGPGRVQTLVGGRGRDQLFGGWHADVFLPGGDDDLINGKFGPDLVWFRGVVSAVHLDLREGRATGAGLDSLRSVEHAVGGLGNDVLLGNGAPNRLAGGGGDDRLVGRAGSDRFTCVGGTDSVWAGHGRDMLDFSALDAPLEVDMDVGRARAEDVDCRFGSVRSVLGGSGPDEMTGNALHNRLAGGGGADVLRGKGGDDFLLGGKLEANEEDIADGGPGVDLCLSAQSERCEAG